MNRRFTAFTITLVVLGSLTLPGSLHAQEPFIGEIRLFAGNFAPRGWALCDGQLLQISQNQALFSILGTTYGGDGRTTFRLPDLRGRAPIHAGTGPGLTARRLGESGGQERVALSESEMPAHIHSSTAGGSSAQASRTSPADNVWASKQRTRLYGPATSQVAMHSDAVVIGSSGGGQSHPNMQPYLTMNYIIALVGIFPSRN